MPFTTLISVEQLRERMAEPDLVVLDARFTLDDESWGTRAFVEGHIPGAQRADLAEDMAGEIIPGVTGRRPFPDAVDFIERVRGWGVGDDTQVVVYDADGGLMAASRLWVMLRWVGHDSVAVLDGGWGKWLREERPETSAVPTPAPSRFDATVREASVDAAYVLAHLRDPSIVVVDARGAERYRGETEPLDPVAGHIPGSINRPIQGNLAEGGVFKSAEALRAQWTPLLGAVTPSSVVHSCGSGVAACHNLLAMEIAGLAGSRLYAGSWSEWCADPARPVATGPNP